ncbi:MAG TPA: glycoside hydrolase family 65 protein, partial [Actinopolymorphaceae bacterium]|nr:glycoside hydrolase family 65 protein [Actinopolymorphaceae bacterium]
MPEWCVTYDGWDPAGEGLREALCTLGNGFFATRGATPESVADGIHYPGTYVAGCYDRLDSAVAGRTVENEDLVNVPNWLPLSFRIEGGGWFDLDDVELLQHTTELDLHHGLLTRRLLFRDDTGRSTRVVQRRLVSMADQHLAALETTFVPQDWSGRMVVRAGLDGRVSNQGVARYRDLNGAHLRPLTTGNDGVDGCWLQVETMNSRIRIAEAARVRLTGAAAARTSFLHDDGWTSAELEFEVGQGQPVTVEKTVALFTSQDKAIEETLPAACTAVRRAPAFDAMVSAHAMAWDRLWSICRVVVHGKGGDGSPVATEDPQLTLDLYVFHLLQSLSEHTIELDVGVPARGLHGEAYRGHVFWDELFVFGFYVVRLPEVARALLLYRWRRLAQARWEAAAAGYRGAMYPWQSGSDGREETPTMHLNPRSSRWLPDNSALQRHVGIAVAYNVWRYHQATGDMAFLASHGAEMLLEIARFWASVTTYDGRFHRYE